MNCIRSNTTLVVFITYHSDITFISQIFSPWIWNDPVINSFISSISNGAYCMAEAYWSTVWIVINSACIGLKVPKSSVNCDITKPLWRFTIRGEKSPKNYSTTKLLFNGKFIQNEHRIGELLDRRQSQTIKQPFILRKSRSTSFP